MSEPGHLTRTRAGYDAIAEVCADMFRTEFDDAPYDRAVLAGFAESVRRDHPDARTLDVGCGHGVVTAFLAGHGLDVRGIDLSAEMVGFARRAHPGITFDVGEMSRLPVPDGDLAALVAWYSLIHVPAGDRPGVVAGFARALRPGGYLALGFQAGTGIHRRDEAFGHAIELEFHRLDPDDVAALLADNGFDVVLRLVRAPEERSAAAQVPQACVVARRTAK
ncbi:class I SAM-dependent methyltransferase [Pseudonocardia phyllosphaerae]|uniref:class I SAM-dependent methyltransferase n=1 Tax=Pseudonocardia phyllosphaerae TaxID=3390502 RepID=UPI00397BBE58